MSLTKIFKYVSYAFLGILLLFLLRFNVAFYHAPAFATNDEGTYNKDVYHQLRYLQTQMHVGAASEMQRLFPEGYLFTNALYGLAWADWAAPLSGSTNGSESALFQEAEREISWAIAEIESPRGRRIFKEDLPLPYGAFYRGWSNYLRGRHLTILPEDLRITEQVERFRAECDSIAKAFQAVEEPYLESYAGGSWPADNVLAVASLAAYDRMLGEKRYAATVTNWLSKVNTRLDPATGLIPHVVYSGAPPQGARGSSQSLMLSLLPEIDSAFAAAQYRLYEQHFVTSRLNLPAIREYPVGIEGQGDIDSGPVIWGIGGAASVVGQRAAAANGRPDRYIGLRNSIEAFGAAYTLFGRKQYVFGQLPLADAFIAWANAAEQEPSEGHYPHPWLLHGLALLVGILLGWLMWRL